MSNGTSQGLYITMFMFFVGLSAGGLIAASSATPGYSLPVFHVEQFKKVVLPAVVLPTVCISVAARSCSSILAASSAPGTIFGLQIAREGWYSAIMAPIFVASAMDSGLALLLIALIGLSAAKVFELGKRLMGTLAGLLATCIAVDASFIGCEILTVACPQTGRGMETLGEMFSGATAPFFWFEMIAGLLVPPPPFLVFSRNRQRTARVASVRVVHPPQHHGAPGISSGSSAAAHADASGIWAVASSYAPTWVELAVAAGVVSLGALAFLVLTHALLKPYPARRPRKLSDRVAGEGASPPRRRRVLNLRLLSPGVCGARISPADARKPPPCERSGRHGLRSAFLAAVFPRIDRSEPREERRLDSHGEGFRAKSQDSAGKPLPTEILMPPAWRKSTEFGRSGPRVSRAGGLLPSKRLVGFAILLRCGGDRFRKRWFSAIGEAPRRQTNGRQIGMPPSGAAGGSGVEGSRAAPAESPFPGARNPTRAILPAGGRRALNDLGNHENYPQSSIIQSEIIL